MLMATAARGRGHMRAPSIAPTAPSATTAQYGDHLINVVYITLTSSSGA